MMSKKNIQVKYCMVKVYHIIILITNIHKNIIKGAKYHNLFEWFNIKVIEKH